MEIAAVPPKDGIHVSSIITAADGGEDARIEWEGGPERTPFLPARLTQFQLKATGIGPKAAGDEILTATGESMTGFVDSLLAANVGPAGKKYVPYIFSMSPFGVLKTAEQWRTDADYNHLPVRLVGRLSGLAMGYFGTSHYAVEDIAIARTFANTTVVSPADQNAVLALMRSTADCEGPVYIRIAEAVDPVYDTVPDIPRGTWPRLREGGDLTLAAHGMGVGLAVQAAEVLASEHGISADVYDGGYLKPFDEAAITGTAARTGKVLTIEDHTVNGGIGAIVAETVARHKIVADLAQCALPDVDLEVGVPAELYEYYGLTVAGVVARALDLVKG